MGAPPAVKLEFTIEMDGRTLRQERSIRTKLAVMALDGRTTTLRRTCLYICGSAPLDPTSVAFIFVDFLRKEEHETNFIRRNRT